MQLDAAWIAAHIPHKGSMCLLDGVESWSDVDIVCLASSHRAPDNPLRMHGRLGMLTGIEYAAQTIAVHSILIEHMEQPPSSGFLTIVRNVQWQRPHLDDIDGVLSIRATRMLGNSAYVLYNFSLRADNVALMSGQASILVSASAATP